MNETVSSTEARLPFSFPQHVHIPVDILQGIVSALLIFISNRTALWMFSSNPANPVAHRAYNHIIFYLSFYMIKESGMSEFLGSLYPWVKALHIMAVIAWMAGLFYLPRLFVYHAERGQNGEEPAASFRIMEDKLLRMIMNPAMILAWVCGLALVLTPGIVDWSMAWPWTKAAAVLAMTWFHMWLAGQRRQLAAGHALSGRTYRMMNELPTLLMVVIVLSVILKF